MFSSHDHQFINTIASRVIELTPKGVVDKMTTFDEYLENDDLQKKIAALEKQLQWEKLRADALDTMIDVAEQKLNINIRKKSGSPRSGK